jgi:succinate dehydrogenase / fumarate reductase membrane anchor subunit
MSLRSPLGQALGLGSAKSGTEHWWGQRVSAVALVPLTLWFAFSLLLLPNLDFDTLHAWLQYPITGFLTALLLGVLTYHSYLGTRVIVEDYVHAEAPKLIALLALRFLHVLAGGAGIFAILRVAFGT